MQTVRRFHFKVDSDISAKAYGKLPLAFPELENLPSLSRTHTRVTHLSKLQATRIDCCVDSCVAFTGPYERLEECPHCGKERYEMDPKSPNQQ